MTRGVWTLCAALALAVCAPMATADQGDVIDVIIMAELDGQTAADAVIAAGGVVTRQYVNLPGVAARIPVSRLAAVRGVPGITSVEKDGIVEIIPGPNRLAEGQGVVSAQEFGELRALDYRDLGEQPEGYLNYILTEAISTWAETGAGAGSIVAVVDTGTAPVVPCLSSGQVIGAPGYPQGYDSLGEGDATDFDNAAHGTWVAGTVAGACSLGLPATDELAQAFLTHAPWALIPDGGDGYFLNLLGIAPGASIYPVKVFPKAGGGTATAAIIDGLDHLITLKLSGFDIDIVNMSLGGGTVFDGQGAPIKVHVTVENRHTIGCGTSGIAPTIVR